MSRTRKINVLFAAILALAIVILLLHNVGSRAGLQRYKAELRAKGDKLTFAEFAMPPSTSPEHIACRKLFATNRFSFPSDTVQMMEYVAPGRVKLAWRGKLHVDPTNNEADISFIYGDWGELDNASKNHASELELFRIALRNPAPDLGWNFQDTMQNLTNSWSGPRPWVTVRSVLFGLTYAAIDDLHHDDLEGAVKNLKAITSLAQFDRNDPVLISPLIQAVIVKMGVDLTWQALQATNWRESDLKSLQDDWQKVDLLGGAERGLLGERAKGAIIAEEVRRTPAWKVHQFFDTTTFLSGGQSAKRSLRDYWNERVVPLLYRITSINEDESLQFRQMTAQVEAVRMLEANRPWPEASLILSNRTAEFESKLGTARARRNLLSRLTVPMFNDSFQRIGAAETERRLAVTAIALKRYELRYRRPPATLAALVPEFLEAVPLDPMSAKPLCYRLKNDGTYVLYSVGEDGKDDGGDASPVSSAGKPGLWEGRDAIWPVVASDEEVAKEETEEVKKPE